MLTIDLSLNFTVIGEADLHAAKRSLNWHPASLWPSRSNKKHEDNDRNIRLVRLIYMQKKEV